MHPAVDFISKSTATSSVIWNFNKINEISIIVTRGVPRILIRGGGASEKLSNKVARISVRGGDIQQKFTQQRLFLKNLYKIRTKILKTFSEIYQKNINKYKKFKNF